MAAGGCHPTPAGRAAGCEVCVQGWFSGRLVPARATQEKWVTSPGPGPLSSYQINPRSRRVGRCDGQVLRATTIARLRPYGIARVARSTNAAPL